MTDKKEFCERSDKIGKMYVQEPYGMGRGGSWASAVVLGEAKGAILRNTPCQFYLAPSVAGESGSYVANGVIGDSVCRRTAVHAFLPAMSPYGYVVLDVYADMSAPKYPDMTVPSGLSDLAIFSGSNRNRMLWKEPISVDAARMVWREGGIIDGTMLKYQISKTIYATYPTIPVMEFELFIVNSDFTNPDTVQEIRDLVICRGLAPLEGLALGDSSSVVIDFLQESGFEVRSSSSGKDMHVSLSKPTWLGFGQGILVRGRLQLGDLSYAAMPALEASIVLDEPRNIGFGPLDGEPTAAPCEMTLERGYGAMAARDVMLDFLSRHGPGTVFKNRIAGRYTGADYTESTGDQNGFGVTKMSPMLSPNLSNPFHLYESFLDIVREAARPSFYYETDATPISLKSHPLWRTWGCQTHWHPNVSPDQLGKPPMTPRPSNTLGAQDWAHMQVNHLAGWTALKGSVIGSELCQQLITCLKASTDMGGETRAWGRGPLSMAWLAWAINDHESPRQFAEMLCESGDLNEFLDKEDTPCRTFHAPFDPGGGYFGGLYRFWFPWQEALAVTGLYALATVIDAGATREKLLSVVDILGTSWVNWGFAWRGDLCEYRHMFAIRWNEGQGYTEEQYQSDDWVHVGGWTHNELCLSTLRIMRTRTLNSDLEGKIDGFLAQMLANRRETGTGFDRFGEWDLQSFTIID